jgi:quinol monooxygenase YgiN
VAPYPPRYCCFESFVTREQGWDGIDATTRWLAAVDRVMPGHPLAPVKSHVAMYARRHEGQAPGPVGGATDVSEWIIATEVLNAKYTGPAMEEVRRRLIEHADASLARGQVLAFDVLQSVESPTCFKTWELYPSMSAFQEHMSAVDAAFAESVLPWRAAVNRVRQIYAPLVCLFADA